MKYGQLITYKGRQMWLMDTAGKDEKARLEAWEEARQVLAKERNGILAVIDCRNTAVTTPVLKKAVELADMIQGDPRFCVAFVGLTGVYQSTAQVYTRTRRVNAYFCDSVEDAKEWLVKEAGKPPPPPETPTGLRGSH